METITHKDLEAAGLIRQGKLYLRASELGTWLGLTPWSNPSQLVQQYMGKVPRRATARMRMGTVLEEAILNEAAKVLGLSIWSQQNEGLLELPSRHFDGIVITGHVDAVAVKLVGSGDVVREQAYILEAKYMPNAKLVDIPDYYVPQVLSYHLMHGFGVYFVALCDSDELFIREVSVEGASDRLLEWVRAIEDMFYEGTFNTPYAWRKRVSTYTKLREVPDVYADKVRRMLEINSRLGEYRQLLKELDELKSELKEALEAGAYQGFRVYLNTREEVDVQRLKEMFPEVYEAVKVQRQYKSLWIPS